MVPQPILDLVEHFDRNISELRSSAYNETEVRREFLDPFFEALGWDVNNHLHYSETYKDVVHEPAREMEHGTPDYCFRVGGTSKFYVEAKKPAVRLKDNPDPALQLRRYAWSSKLPLSILSSFDELAIYDCRTAPRLGDKASTARIAYYTFQEYPEKWDEIASRFSKEAVLQGSFDRFVESSKAKKGTAEVDSAFLQDIQSWRYELAASIASRNPGLGQREVNFAVQRTIDRIIFLRICEDRGLERYGQLRDLSQQADVYQHLCDLFRKGDERYNSGLFHFHKEKDRAEDPDTLTPTIKIDDWRLKPILKRLYYPDSPYAFSHVPADILGQVYEQFLGQVIRITSKRRVEVEPKPEVKKAHGVYYTPTYVVDYIVKNTVGKLVDGKTPKQLANIRVLDPACGSGSFLIGAYQFLLNWYRDEYVKDGPQKHKNQVVRDEVGNWRLTLDEKKKILIRHIYGVDVDTQAVEVTKLSLLLKVLEGESQFKLFHERALPDLGNNIKCGNSLIGPDFYDNQQMLLLDEEDRYRINVFDWKQGFPEVMKNGGFDAVIGNPPYVRIQTTEGADISYLGSHYKSATGNYDVYCLFVERGISLLGPEGHFGFIVPHRFIKTDYGQGLRGLILSNRLLERIIDFDGYMVFPQASINTCILLLSPKGPSKFDFIQLRNPRLRTDEVVSILSRLPNSKSSNVYFGKVPWSSLTSGPWVFISEVEESIWSKLNSEQPRLGEITTHIFQGLKTSADEIYIGELVGSKGSLSLVQFKGQRDVLPLETKIMKPLIKGGEMRRYHIGETSKRILFPYSDGKLFSPAEMKTLFPNAWKYLLAMKDDLEAREERKMAGDSWYAYGRSQALNVMTLPKIITPDYYAHASFCLDEQGTYYFCGGGAGGYGIVLRQGFDHKFVLGLLNSKLLDWFLRKVSMRAYQTAYMYVKKYIEQLPIEPIDSNRKQSIQDKIVVSVQGIRGLTEKLASTNFGQRQTVIQRQIDATSQQIDKLVYDLYGLTQEEIAIVESTVGPVTPVASTLTDA
jgi:type I restriction-modification system DNA methylase subunit